MNEASRQAHQSTWRIYLWPVAINLVCVLGLLSALVGNGWLDVLSWTCLGASVVLMVFAYWGDIESVRVSTRK